MPAFWPRVNGRESVSAVHNVPNVPDRLHDQIRFLPDDPVVAPLGDDMLRAGNPLQPAMVSRQPLRPKSVVHLAKRSHRGDQGERGIQRLLFWPSAIGA